ncbi:MAG: phosphatidate cytidylyltransferase [Gammaproteobacteria bacterium]|nr:phosphatidate cytidylyltransferase [Gammaproteobacteria bacterium]
MHSKRIITGFILGLMAIWSIFWWPSYAFILLCTLLMSWAALEWIAFVKIKRWWQQAIAIAVLWALMVLGNRYDVITYYISILWWIVGLGVVLLPFKQSTWLKRPVFLLPLGLVLLIPTWVAIINLQQQNPTVLFYLIMLICFADTGAYFVGTKWGKHKLFPVLSPKKSLEGLIGGLVVGSVAGMGVTFFIPNQTAHHYVMWLVLGFFLILVSVLGDVFESLVKRQCEIKDSGNILPGHGGVFDRIDSLTATLPVFALVCIILGLIQ